MYPTSGHVLYSRNRRSRMFIDCAKLEKILKADYKSWGR